MQRIVAPYHWEILATMLTYKLSGGTCIDFDRITGEDVSIIDQTLYIPGIDKLMTWGRTNPPTDKTVPQLVEYISDWFPYQDLESFLLGEENAQMLYRCPTWPKYLEIAKAPEGTNANRAFQDIKAWACDRTVALAKKSSHVFSFTGLHNQATAIKPFVGKYRYFMPGQIPPGAYENVYMNELEIKEDASVVMFHNHLKIKPDKRRKEFYGNATVRDKIAMQIILFSENNGVRDGFDYAINIKIDNYAATVDHFPGIVNSFNGSNNIYAYPVLLTSNLALEFNSEFIVRYFKECYDLFVKRASVGRMECLAPARVQELAHLYIK